jgi:hypothetical protein
MAFFFYAVNFSLVLVYMNLRNPETGLYELIRDYQTIFYGRLIYSEELRTSQKFISLNTSDWSSGMYHCIVSNESINFKETIEIIH